MRRLILSMGLLWFAAVPCLAISINEVRIDQPSTDNDEYFELAGTSGESLDTLTYLVIGDGPNSGTIEAVVSLANQFIPDDGYFLAVESTFGAMGTPFEDAMPDLTTALLFENSDNVTHVLVDGFFGSMNDDLDTNDDGILDSLPWTNVVDAVCLIEDPTATTSEHFYCGELGGFEIGPVGNSVPDHGFRIPDQNGDFVIGAAGLGTDDTPGRANQDTGTPAGCDFDDDGVCDCDDIDDLVAEIAAGTHGSEFDVNGDGSVDGDDLEEWLAEAGEMQLASGEPYLVGDANLDGAVNGQDFVIWNDHKFTNVAAWCSGDFNADGSVNGQDFVLWNNNKFMMADGNFSAVPEPTGVLLPWLCCAAIVWMPRRITI